MHMQNRVINLLIRSVAAVLLGIGLALLLNTKSVAGDIKLDSIETKTDLYQNVTVTGHNETDIFIIHSQGMANVKIKDLDPETLWRVGLGEKPIEPGSEEAIAAAQEEANAQLVPAALNKVFESTSIPGVDKEMQEKMKALATSPAISLEQINPQILAIVAGVALILHLFFSYCLKLIVQKTGNEPGLMVWLPFFQVFPALRAAGMSAWWVLLLLLPLINTVVSIVWCVKIVKARGKSAWTTLFLILPPFNLFAYLYLAFSSADSEVAVQDTNSGRIVIEPAFGDV